MAGAAGGGGGAGGAGPRGRRPGRPPKHSFVCTWCVESKTPLKFVLPTQHGKKEFCSETCLTEFRKAYAKGACLRCGAVLPANDNANANSNSNSNSNNSNTNSLEKDFCSMFCYTQWSKSRLSLLRLPVVFFYRFNGITHAVKIVIANARSKCQHIVSAFG